MIEQQVFIGLLLVIGAYALWRGGFPERAVALAFLLATLLSVVMAGARSQRFHHAENGVLLVDIMLFLSLFWLAMRSARWWPLFVAAFQLDALVVHLMRVLLPHVEALAYLNGTALWSYPMLVILAAATARHRSRLRSFGSDPAWKALEAVRPRMRGD